MSFLVGGYKKVIFLLLLSAPAVINAQPSASTMSGTAQAGQKMQNSLYPQMQMAMTYNYSQKIGINNGSQQSEFEIQPIIPIKLGEDLQLLLNPMLTFNRNIHYPQATNQMQPVQLSTFFVPRYVGNWYFGMGPYYQAPASNSLNGSRQTGLGVSAGAFYTPENWTFGVVMYNGWGVGSDLSGGSANILNVQPAISYTTDGGWTYSLSNQLNYYSATRNSTNQLTLSGGKTVQFLGRH